MIKVGIAGVTGYTGIELVKLISNHPKAKLCAVNSNSYKGKALTEVFPSMRLSADFRFSNASMMNIMLDR